MEQEQYEELKKYVQTEDLLQKSSREWDTFDHESLGLESKIHEDMQKMRMCDLNELRNSDSLKKGDVTDFIQE